MKNIRLRFTLIVFLIVFPWKLTFAQATLTQILNNGPSSNRINVVFFPDGYTESQLPKFLNTDVYLMMNSFFNNLPFNEYKSFYNVYVISVASNESGSDHPSSGIYRDTYFSSTFETAGIARLLTLSGNGYMRADSLLQQFVPDYDLVVVVVNDPEYGGSGGGIAVTSIHSAAPEVVVHEMGHSFGGLADEYDTYTPGYSGYEGPNTTAETRRDFIKWFDWILDATPIPTPPISEYSDVVGLFEGACYELYGWYRPKLACKMRSLGPPFCEVCGEQLLKMQYARLAMIDSSYPASAFISLVNTESATLGIVPLVPVSHTLNVRWYVNGLLAPTDTSSTFSTTGRELGNGSSTVTCKIIDNTDLVRNDPAQYLQDSSSWTITVSGVIFSPPDLAAPDDGMTKVSLNPTLSWHPVPGATSYRLQLAASADFSETIFFQVNIPDTSFTVSLPNSGQYFWRVASEDLQGHSAYSFPRSFFTIISIPSLVKPPNGSTDQLIPFVFKWRKIGGTVSYRLQVASDSFFTLMVKDTANITDTVCHSSELTTFEKYYWHVSAKNPVDSSQYSATWSFLTIDDIPPLSADKNVVDFRQSVEVGTSKVDSITMRNSWGIPVKITSVKPSFTDVSVYPESITIGPKSTQKFYITFSPQSSGGRVGEIYFYNLGPISPFVVGLLTAAYYPPEFNYTVSSRWSIFSLPMNVYNPRVSVLFPSALKGPYCFTADSGYQLKDTLEKGIGYWIRFPSEGTVKIFGHPVEAETIVVRNGWNLVGTIHTPLLVTAVRSDPPGMVVSNFFGYEGGYTVADTLMPGCGYWVKAGEEGRLILSSLGNVPMSSQIKIIPGSELPPALPDENVGSGKLIPTRYELGQNYPNPFNPLTRITYGLPERSTVKLEIFNMLGQNVATLVNGDKEAGYHTVEWNAPIGSGLYFYRMTAVCSSEPSKTFTQVKKMLLVK